jgi:hypothetical protein
MTTPGPSNSALVILPPNFLGEVNNQAVPDTSVASADDSPAHASAFNTEQWKDVLYDFAKVYRCLNH